MVAGFSLRHDITTRHEGPAGVLAETPLPLRWRHTSVFSPLPPTLSGGGSDGHGDPTPGVAPRRALRQVQHESADRPLDPARQFQQPLPQGRDLRRGTGGALRLAAQFLEQHIGRRGEQDTELIGPEPRATRSAQGQAVMQLLEPILHIASLTIQGIDCCGGLTEIGHDEAGITLGIPSRQAHDLGLDNHPAATRPTSGGIEGVAIDVLSAATVLLDRP